MPEAYGWNAGAGRERWTGAQRQRRRELSQNFLKRGRDANRIVAASGIGSDDLVVELGAGGGMLTHRLAGSARGVIAVEYDPHWVGRLEERFSGTGNVRVVHEDALALRLPEEPFKVVANVPFHLTARILQKLLDDPTGPLEAACLLVEDHVARRHARTAPTTLKTLRWSPWYRFYAGLALRADAFLPEPRVNARLMVAAKRGPPLLDPRHRHLFRAFVRQAFTGRGDTVGRSLRPVYTKTQLRRLAKANGFSPHDAPSSLTVRQWVSAFEVMLKLAPAHRWPAVGKGP